LQPPAGGPRMTGVRPGFEEFARLAGEHSVVPVWRELLGDLETPVGAFRKLGDQDGSVLLESVEHGERWGRYSFIGTDPFATLTIRGGRASWTGRPPAGLADGPPLEVLREALRRLRSPSLPGLPPLFAGAVGYLGYDLVRELERLPDQTEDDLQLPDGMLVFPRSVVVFDHLGQRLVLVANVLVEEATDLDAAYADAGGRLDALAARLSLHLPAAATPLPAAGPPAAAGSDLDPGRDQAADRRHPAARRRPGGRPRPGGRAAGGREGARRARHAGRPGPQRPRPGVPAGDRAGRRLHAGGALLARHAPGLRRGRGAGRRGRRLRRAGRQLPGGDGVGGAEGAGDGDHRRPGAPPARPLRRLRRLLRLLRQPRHLHHHPHLRVRGRGGVLPGRRRGGGRLGARAGGARDRG